MLILPFGTVEQQFQQRLLQIALFHFPDMADHFFGKRILPLFILIFIGLPIVIKIFRLSGQRVKINGRNMLADDSLAIGMGTITR